jgi:oligopeptide/dipeptide ABC transporter ATP-binding protein
MTDVLIEVKGLVKEYVSHKRLGRSQELVRAVDGVSFVIRRGETLGLVGETGCGKSTTGRCLVRLVEPTSGEVLFDGENILRLGRKELRTWRRRAQIIFQDPFSSLNPRMRICESIAEPLRVTGSYRAMGGARWIAELLHMVGLDPEHSDRFPHEFSGGQRQRIAIARALAIRPEFVICDEPVTSLDVSIRSQILNLLCELQRELALTYLFISHDLGVVRRISDRVAVMYLGKIVEEGPVSSVYSHPSHPYTQSLLSAVPVPNPRDEAARSRIMLAGDIPSAFAPPAGCRFHPRCFKCEERCSQSEPLLETVAVEHRSACFYPNGSSTFAQ